MRREVPKVKSEEIVLNVISYSRKNRKGERDRDAMVPLLLL